MKKQFFSLAFLLGWHALALAQVSLVPSYLNDRISTDFNGNSFDWQRAFRPNFTQTLISNEGRLAQRGGVGEVLYYYRVGANLPGQQPLQRPIIILDGFDPLDTRSGQEVYGKQLSYIEGSGPGAPRRLLGEILRGFTSGSTDNFDVIILNFPRYLDRLQRADQDDFTKGGAGDIRDNAMILVSLIRQVNAELAQAGSQEEIVVIGPSMGGLISRYALAYMEAQGIPHRCRLWVSFDSPHLGANIAIGAQQFLKYYASNGKEAAQKSYNDKINSPAARQMLSHHEEAFSAQAAGVWDRQEFVDDLLANGLPGSGGFPQNPLRVAIANGSQSGQRFSTTECQPALEMNSNLSFINPDHWARNVAMFILRSPTFFFRVPAARSILRYSGSNGNQCLTCAASYLTVNTDRYGASPGLSLDAAPGGNIDVFKVVADEGSGYGFPANTSFNVTQPLSSFIPLKSALAFNHQAVAGSLLNPAVGNLAENLSARNLVCEGLTPFHAYFAPAINEEHVQLTQASVDFILPYIRGTADPVFRLRVPNAFPIQASSFCPSDAGGSTYSVSPSHLPPNATGIQWVASPGLQIVGASNQNSVTVRRLGGASTQEWVRARVFTPCQVFEGEQRLLGRLFGSSDYPVTGPSSAGNNQLVTYFAPDLWGATSFQWITPGWEVVSGLNTRILTLRTPASGGGVGQIGVRVHNLCGLGGSPAFKETRYCSGGCPPGPGLDSGAPEPLAAPTKPLLYPNPASGMATVAVGVERGQPTQMQLATASGQVVRSVGGSAFVLEPTTGQYRANIDLANLPAGIYLVRLWLADEITTLKLVVQPSGGGALSN
jgi:hypothetical protein